MEKQMVDFFRRWNNLPAKKKQPIGVVVFSLILLSFLTDRNTDSSPTKILDSAPNGTTQVKPFPKLDDKSDGILENIIRDFHRKNETSDWWDRIEVIKEGIVGNETAKMVYIKTDYRLNNVDDAEDAALLCNALVSFLPRSGLSVRVDGLIEKGRTLLDGTIETAIVEEPATEFGASWDKGRTPDWCVASVWFVSVKSGLLERGWKEKYFSGDLTDIEKQKVFSANFAQKGSTWFVN
jgi:hypothetical protein